MIFDPKYGPQFDSSDGTIGKLKLARRFVLVRDKELFSPRQGRYTYPTRKEADRLRDKFLKNHPPGHHYHHFVKGLEVEEWWCYPRHFDPVGPIR